MRIITTVRRAGARRACTGRRGENSAPQRRSARSPSQRTGFFCAAPRRISLSGRLAPMLRIALPNKGRLSEEARELFTDAGLEIRAAGPRALTASLGGEF